MRNRQTTRDADHLFVCNANDRVAHAAIFDSDIGKRGYVLRQPFVMALFCPPSRSRHPARCRKRLFDKPSVPVQRVEGTRIVLARTDCRVCFRQSAKEYITSLIRQAFYKGRTACQYRARPLLLSECTSPTEGDERADNRKVAHPTRPTPNNSRIRRDTIR